MESNGYKLGERFLKIVFDNALKFGVEEIYVTAFVRTEDQERLIRLLEDWGFARHGTKTSKAGTEQVFVRKFSPRLTKETLAKPTPTSRAEPGSS